jgi:low density lipoprotein-related protein 2
MCASAAAANSTCPGQFTCRNQNCVDTNSLCNGQNDCRDNSDEYGCGVNECSSPVLNRCTQICRDTLTSFQCECRSGFKLAEGSSYMCIDIDECKEKPYVCSQLCENRPGGYTCKCAQGYERSSSSLLESNVCKVIGPRVEATLLFTNNYYLRSISLGASSDYELIRDGFGAARGLAYDYNASVAFVLDGATRQLIKIKINSNQDNDASVSATLVIKNYFYSWEFREFR